MTDYNVILSNQIAGCFVHQYLWKGQCLDFLDENINQKKKASKIFVVVGSGQVCPATGLAKICQGLTLALVLRLCSHIEI